MQPFLCFRLYGPMAAWGDVAVGERRPALAQPSRSGVLGLIAAAWGLRRSDADALQTLDDGLGFASRLERRGELLVDYHTAQVPSGPEVRAALKRRARLDARRDELKAKEDRDAIQSWRTYFLDAVASACVWHTSGSRAPALDQLAAKLRAPTFVPYLGRKACPVALPLDAKLVEAANPVDALAQVHFPADALLGANGRAHPEPEVFRWEGEWPGLKPDQTVTRRDRLLSRARWHFAERQEHVLQRQVGDHVPQPS